MEVASVDASLYPIAFESICLATDTYVHTCLVYYTCFHKTFTSKQIVIV
jgi:hypothetical protein